MMFTVEGRLRVVFIDASCLLIRGYLQNHACKHDVDYASVDYQWT